MCSETGKEGEKGEIPVDVIETVLQIKPGCMVLPAGMSVLLQQGCATL